MGGRAFDSNALVSSSIEATPDRWKLPVLVGAVLFSAGACCGVQLGESSPNVPASRDACPASSTYSAPAPGCVWVPQTGAAVPPAVGVAR